MVIQKNKLLVLIDIDGTLISGGLAPRHSLIKAVKEYTGKSVTVNFKQLAGLTDPIIVSNILVSLGYDKRGLDGIVGQIIDRYIEILMQKYPKYNDKRVLPGVIPFLDYLNNMPFRVGLLTGNVEHGAKIKLEPFGIMKYFSFGVFGEEGLSRNQLPLVALEKANKFFGEFFSPPEVVIVGDTPRDIICAHSNQMNSMIILQRNEWREDIKNEKPEFLVESLEPLKPISEWFDNLLH